MWKDYMKQYRSRSKTMICSNIKNRDKIVIYKNIKTDVEQ